MDGVSRDEGKGAGSSDMSLVAEAQHYLACKDVEELVALAVIVWPCAHRSRRPAGGRVDHRGRLAEILRTDRGGRDGTEGLHVLTAVVVEPVNGAARNAEGLPWPDVNSFAVHHPGQQALDPVDRLLV